MCNARALLDCTLTNVESTVDYGFHEIPKFRTQFDRAIKSSVSTLGDTRIKETKSLQRKVILGFLPFPRQTGYSKSLIFTSSRETSASRETTPSIAD